MRWKTTQKENIIILTSTSSLTFSIHQYILSPIVASDLGDFVEIFCPDQHPDLDGCHILKFRGYAYIYRGGNYTETAFPSSVKMSRLYEEKLALQTASEGALCRGKQNWKQ